MNLADWLHDPDAARKLWADFHRTLDAPSSPRRRRRLEKLRAQMPPGGVSSPLWPLVLR